LRLGDEVEKRYRLTEGPILGGRGEVWLAYDKELGQDVALKRAGHDAFVVKEGDGPETCLVLVVHRSYADQHGEPAVEMLHLVVGGPRSMDKLCGMATDLAGSAAAELPGGAR
jgi:hypothetical protein